MNSRCLPLVLLVLISIQFPSLAQTKTDPKQTDAAARIAELEKRIGEQKTLDSSLAIELAKLSADSAAADSASRVTIDLLTKKSKDLDSAAGQLQRGVSALQREIAGLEADLKKPAVVNAAAARARATAAKLNVEAARAKQSLETSIRGLDRAQQDSAAAATRTFDEAVRLRDSLKGVDTSISLLKKQIDSVSALKKKAGRDTASEWKKLDDSLKVAVETLREARRLAAKNDSIVKAATNDLGARRKDSAEAYSKSILGNKDRDREKKILDSLSLALHDRKTTLLRFEEKLKLDSIIDAVAQQVRDLTKGGAVSEAAEEMRQLLESYKTKRAVLMQERTLAAMAARSGKTGREEMARQTAAQLSFVQRSLDSVGRAREELVRNTILLEKESMENSRLLAKQNDTLSVSITNVSKELTNQKARISKLERDSAEAFERRAVAAEARKKKQEAITADIAKKKTLSDTLARRRNALADAGKKRDANHGMALERARASIGKAAAAKQRSQSAYDSLSAEWQKAKNDSSAAFKEIDEKATSANLTIAIKQGEMTVKGGELKKITDQLAKTKADRARAVSERNRQKGEIGKKRAELRQRMLQGKQKVKGLEAERDAIKKRAAGK